MNITLIVLSGPFLSTSLHLPLSQSLTTSCLAFTTPLTSAPIGLSPPSLQILVEVTNLEGGGGLLLPSICLTTTIMGWKTEMWGEGRVWRQQGVMGQGWWVAWGGGVNIVMISPVFLSSGPMRRERDRGIK